MKHLATFLIVVASTSGFLAQNSRYEFSEDATMTFRELANKYSDKGEEYDLTVEDGYILKLFRIPGDQTKPVLFIHGAQDSADSFIVRGNTSMAVALSRENYDVWAINLRGNRYSRSHTSMNPDTNSNYWDFSVHEYGYYDLPTTIDFILNKTGQKQISAIGYSEGTTTMYVLGITRPEYNNKIKIFISLAPICYMHNARMYMSLLMDFAPVLNQVALAIGYEEVIGQNSQVKSIINSICSTKGVGYEICILNCLFHLTGPNSKELEPEFLPTILGHFPAGTSRKNLIHLAQVRSNKRFANYDYGAVGNMARYNRLSPPEYDLSKVTMKVALVVAKNDRISTIKDVALLRKQLPNVVEYKVMKKDAFNHIDYIWGRNAYKELGSYLTKILDKYQ